MSQVPKLLVIPFSIVAIASGAHLAWSAIQLGSVAGCTGSGVWDCDHVLHSPWSKLFGVPVSIPAIGIHIGLIALLWVSWTTSSRRLRQFSEKAALLCACCAALAAVWFVGLQVVALGKFCKFCLVAHLCGVVGCVILLSAYGSLQRVPLRPVAMAMGMTTLLAIVQVLGPQPSSAIVETHAPSAQSEPVDFLVMDLDFMDAPLDATPEATASPIPTQSAEQPENRNATVHDLSNSPTKAPTVVPLTTPVLDPHTQPEQELEVVVELDELLLDEVAPIPTPTPVPQVGSEEKPQTQPTGETSRATEERRDEDVEHAIPAEPREVTFPGAKVKLKVDQWPLVGSPKAPVVMAQLFDYTCSHCRQMNRDLVVARSRFPNQLAIIALPVPLNASCNATVRRTDASHRDACELANLAIAVWKVDPIAFADFHDWLCAVEPGRTANDARLEAERRVAPDALREQLTSGVIGKYISQHVTIYQRAGEGTLPKLFTDAISVSGKMNNANDLCNALKANHAL